MHGYGTYKFSDNEFEIKKREFASTLSKTIKLPVL
jgi:hypothetical protein